MAAVVDAGERIAQRDLRQPPLIVDLDFVRVGELEGGAGSDLDAVAVDQHLLGDPLAANICTVVAAEIAHDRFRASRFDAAVDARDAFIVELDLHLFAAADLHRTAGRQPEQLAEARAGEDQHEGALRELARRRGGNRDEGACSGIGDLRHFP